MELFALGMLTLRSGHRAFIGTAQLENECAPGHVGVRAELSLFKRYRSGRQLLLLAHGPDRAREFAGDCDESLLHRHVPVLQGA